MPGLDDLLEEMRAFLTMVYDCGFSDLTYEEFLALGTAQRVAAVMAVLPEVNFAAQCRARVAPLLGRPPHLELFCDELVRLSATSLMRARDVIHDCFAATHDLLTDPNVIVDLGIRCVYANQHATQLIHMEEIARMLQRLHAKITRDDVQQRLIALTQHLQAARLVHAHDLVELPYQFAALAADPSSVSTSF